MRQCCCCPFASWLLHFLAVQNPASTLLHTVSVDRIFFSAAFDAWESYSWTREAEKDTTTESEERIYWTEHAITMLLRREREEKSTISCIHFVNIYANLHSTSPDSHSSTCFPLIPLLLVTYYYWLLSLRRRVMYFESGSDSWGNSGFLSTAVCRMNPLELKICCFFLFNLCASGIRLFFLLK